MYTTCAQNVDVARADVRQMKPSASNRAYDSAPVQQYLAPAVQTNSHVSVFEALLNHEDERTERMPVPQHCGQMFQESWTDSKYADVLPSRVMYAPQPERFPCGREDDMHFLDTFGSFCDTSKIGYTHTDCAPVCYPPPQAMDPYAAMDPGLVHAPEYGSGGYTDMGPRDDLF